MSVTATNLVAGPLTLYTGDFGATEPADSEINSTPAASAWTDLGGTNGGIQLVVSQEYMELAVDQIVDRVDSRLTKREIKLVTSLAEVTLTNFQLAFNGGTVTPSGSVSVYEPANDSSATQPEYVAAIGDGWAPGTAGTRRRRIILRKLVSVEEVETNHAKDEQSLIPVTLMAHYVSSAIKPFKIVDATA